MPYTVDFKNVSTVGLESSPVAEALAGLRANEARYFKNKYDHDFTVEPASDAKATIDWVHQILKEGAKIGENDSGSQYNVVYCAGLFDYLSDRICKRLLEIFYGHPIQCHYHVEKPHVHILVLVIPIECLPGGET